MKANSRSTTANPIGQRAMFQNQVNACTLVGPRRDRVAELPAENDQEQVSGEDGCGGEHEHERDQPHLPERARLLPCHRRGSRP